MAPRAKHSREVLLEGQLASALTALNDLHNGHSWRDTGIDLPTMLAQAEALGVTVKAEAVPSSWESNPVYVRLMSGQPTELTDASEETLAVRQVLESDCVFDDPTNPGHEVDAGGDIYWNHNRTVAVYAPHKDE